MDIEANTMHERKHDGSQALLADALRKSGEVNIGVLWAGVVGIMNVQRFLRSVECLIRAGEVSQFGHQLIWKGQNGQETKKGTNQKSDLRGGSDESLGGNSPVLPPASRDTHRDYSGVRTQGRADLAQRSAPMVAREGTCLGHGHVTD